MAIDILAGTKSGNTDSTSPAPTTEPSAVEKPRQGCSMSADLQPLMSQHEAWFRVGDGAEADPAVIINPAASVHALVAAIQSRVDLLNMALSEWTCESDVNTTADRLAEMLHPHAQEASALLNALGQKLRGQP
jgi:hypothetical protein